MNNDYINPTNAWLPAYRQGPLGDAQKVNCATCHQVDGKGIKSAGFPPLKGTQWVLGDEERLIKITLNGVMGKMKVSVKVLKSEYNRTLIGRKLGKEEKKG